MQVRAVELNAKIVEISGGGARADHGWGKTGWRLVGTLATAGADALAAERDVVAKGRR